MDTGAGVPPSSLEHGLALSKEPSLLWPLPGQVEVRSLPGDKMFQATHIVDGFQRPCVLHGYGCQELHADVSASIGR